VHDLGWRPMPGPTPGRPETLVDGRYLIYDCGQRAAALRASAAKLPCA